MLYKWLGTAFLLLAGGYLSFFFVGMERKRQMVLDGYISLLRFIKGQIDCYAMPIEDIMSAADPQVLQDCMGGQGISPYLPLSDMVTQSHVYLEPESERLLHTFISELGQTYRAEQVMRCEYYIQALCEERHRLAENAPMRMRTSCVLCLCVTLGMVILLW